MSAETEGNFSLTRSKKTRPEDHCSSQKTPEPFWMIQLKTWLPGINNYSQKWILWYYGSSVKYPVGQCWSHTLPWTHKFHDGIVIKEEMGISKATYPGNRIWNLCLYWVHQILGNYYMYMQPYILSRNALFSLHMYCIYQSSFRLVHFLENYLLNGQRHHIKWF